MNLQVFTPILFHRGTLEARDLTPEQKKQLYTMLNAHGMPQSTAYIRFFEKGFDEWELKGIDSVKREFCDKQALNHLRNTKVGFYSALITPGTKTTLLKLMIQLGMKNRRTVSSRFDADNWTEWERRGMRDLLTEFAVKCV